MSNIALGISGIGNRIALVTESLREPIEHG